MARSLKKKTNAKSYDNEPRLTTQLISDDKSKEQFLERKRALAFEKVQQILMQNVSKSGNKTFTQYTKSLIKQYLQNPYSNRDSIREVSRYLYRVSTLYKKIILYYATMPYYNYNITYMQDFVKEIDRDKILKTYQNFLMRMQSVDIPKECVPIIATTIRDGIYCGFVYDNEQDGLFLHMLDPKYYKIRGKNADGQWIVYFDATYFSSGSNKEFVEGIDGDMEGTWDQVFVDGWNAYQKDTTNARWFMLPPEKTICLIANLDDEFDMPLPFFCGIFIDLLDVLDYQQIVADKTVLENYCLLVASIPLIDNTNVIDDFAISPELVMEARDQINEVIPDLCVTAVLPGMKLDPVWLSQKKPTEDTDIVSQSIENVFNEAGASQVVVSGGKSSNSVGLKQAIANDMATAFMWVERLESNLQYYIKSNISEDFIFRIHKETWYNREDYLKEMKEAATLGSGKMDYLTAIGMTPYEAYCKLLFENTIGLTSMMIPLQSTYNGGSGDVGAPEKDDGELSPEGIATRDGGNNEGTKANN